MSLVPFVSTSNVRRNEIGLTFPEILVARTAEHANKIAFHFIQEEAPTGSMTYGDMLRLARHIAVQVARVAKPGDRAILLHPPGAGYIVGFLGCMLVGVIPVPCYPPTNKRNGERVDNILRDCDASLALVAEGASAKIRELVTCANWLEVDIGNASSSTDAEALEHIVLRPENVAFLQYTSGSTSAPKGVMATHRNLLHNLASSAAAYQITANAIGATWLPPYHDMGLIGGLLATIYSGASSVVMHPTLFLSRPNRWLKAISDFRVTHSGAPNFALELCIQKVTEAQKKDLNLSSWEVLFCGAEPIRARTLERFYESFKDCGFHREALTPSYGLAEATLLVAASKKGRGPALTQPPASASPGAAQCKANGALLVGSGEPAGGQRVSIVDPERRCLLPDRMEGEIWISGPNVASGYWGKSQETKETFFAMLQDDPDASHFLRTGDLGFFSDGELYVTGRLKDLIILNGRNFYPQDIELAVETSHPALRPGAGAAFTIDIDETQRLIIVQELEFRAKPVFDEVMHAALNAVLDENEGLQVHELVLVKPGSIPKTSSGKIRRSACREQYSNDALDVVARWDNGFNAESARRSEPVAPRTDVEKQLAAMIAELLQIEAIGVHDNFFEMGGHSLLAAQVVARVKRDFSVSLPIVALLEQPTVATLVAAIESAGKQSEDDEAVIPATPDLVSRHQPFPLTDVQQAYLLGRDNAFALGGVATHFYAEIRLTDFDSSRFAEALQRLIARHDMLRAVVRPDGTQQILREVPFYNVPVLNLSERRREDVDAELTRIRDGLSHQTLDSTQWPLFDIRATKISEQCVHLHFSIDLLMVDAGSIGMIARELLQLYFHPQTLLAPLDVSFRDYVVAEQSLRETAGYKRALQYWRERLFSLPPAPALPIAKKPALIERVRFSRRQSAIAAPQWRLCKERAAAVGITPSAFLLTIFAEVLAAWSKSSHFTINLTVARRLPLHPQVNHLAGDFTSLIVLEVDANPRSKFIEKAKMLQARLWADLDHAAVGAIQVLREVNQARGTLYAAMPIVFTSTLTNHNEGRQGDAAFNGVGDVVYSISQTPQVWLDHQVYEVNGRLIFAWDAVDEIFPQGLLDDLFQAYCHRLDELISNRGAWDEAHPQLLPSAHRALQASANTTDGPASNELLHGLFERQARLAPERIAVVAENRTMTYAELRRRSRRLGGELQTLGAAPNALIAVVMEKGWEQVVATLGVLYAGGAYLPLDPDLPAERLAYILECAQASIALTQRRVAERIAWPTFVRPIVVDGDDCDGEGVSLLPPVTTAEDLAYVIYTSGSTGQPKGVMIDHRGVVNTILDVNRRFCISAKDRVFAISSLSFDLSVFDIFGALAAGAAIVVPPHCAASDPSLWLEWMNATGVTIWNSAPALLTLLVDQAETQGAPLQAPLRLALLSGDWIPVNLPTRIRTLAPDVEIISLGGATEASIWSIFYPVGEVSPEWTSIPYGKPLTNQRFYVLDDALAPRPIWATGQLYIGGIGLATGYWRDDEKTNASFIHHPQTGERLYKSGDLGRYLPDGNIEFLGREDSQVKVQGHRIELGEIEAVLEKHPDVRAVVVTVLGERDGEKRLAAYIVANPSSRLSGEALNAYLATKLPAYMTPALFAFLDALPLSANGKVDRKALPTIERAFSAVDDFSFRDADERRIAQIVEEIVDVKPISARINLFTLGINSIDAIRIANALFKALHFRPKLDRFLIDPTIANLVDMYRRRRSGVDAANVAGLSGATSGFIIDPQAREHEDRQWSLKRAPRHEPIPLSFGQLRLWFIDQFMEAQKTAYNVPAMLRLHGALDIEALRFAFNELIARHESLRTAFIAPGGESPDEPVQVIAEKLVLEMPVIELSANEVDEYASMHAAHIFDLAKGPLLKVTLVHLEPTLHVLLINLHHAICDGWSSSVIASELRQLYVAHIAGEEPELPALPIQYADYAHWQRQQDLAPHLDYWTKALAGYEGGLALPYDTPRGPSKSWRLGIIKHRYPAAFAARVSRFSQGNRLSLFMTLLSALFIVLNRYAGRTDLCVGTTVAGRDAVELEGLIGFFVNILPLRIDLSDDPTGMEIVSRVRETALNSYEHQALPFEHLLNALQLERDNSHVALAPVMMRHQNFPQATQEAWASNLEVEHLQAAPALAKCELDIQFYGEGETLDATVEYAADLFKAATIERMLQHLQQALETLIAEPERRLSGFSILTEAEQRLFARNNMTTYPLDTRWSVPQLFERQVQATPDAVACIDTTGTTSYAALNARANQIAHALRAAGVVPEVRVGLCIERSADFLASLLGVFKAGGAYVPLDVNHPAAYLQLIVADARPQVLVTQASSHEWFADTGIKRLCLDAQALDGYPRTDPDAGLKPGHLAYVMYTSGSTGKPKGVMVPHAQILNWLQALWRRMPFESDDVIAQKTTATFAVSVKELLAGLLAGSPQVMLPDAAVKDASAFFDALSRWRVTRLNIVPSHLLALLSIPNVDFDRLRSLKYCITAGEPLTTAGRMEVKQKLPWVSIWNNYGCTELNDITYCDPSEQGSDSVFVSIGRPIANTCVYVLDSHLRPAPIGIAGELCVDSIGMAHGYWGQPALTAERFIPNPFSDQPGARLYKTGDIVCYRDDGSLEYLGRRDFEVKIRGNRIDVRQVEKALMEYPDIAQAVVSSGAMRLIAYYTTAGAVIAKKVLRDYLAKRLPGYMVPNLYVPLETLPKLPNGKLDRMALPALDISFSQTEEYRAARTQTERALVRIWSQLLEIPEDNIGIDNDFFVLGGHSLLATQLITKLRETFQIELPIRAVFESSTIIELGELIDRFMVLTSAENDEAVMALLEGMSDEEAEKLLKLLPDESQYS